MNGVKIFNLTALAMILGIGILAAGCASTSEPRLRGFNNDEVEALMAEQRARMDAGDPVVKSVTDPAALERHGDSMAMRKEFIAAYFEYGRAYKMAKTDDAKLRLRRKMAVISLRGGNFPEAQKQFNALVKIDATDGFAWQGLGLALLSESRPEEALDALSKAVEINPKLWKAQNGLGIIYNRQGQPSKALSAFDQALKVERRSAPLYNNQGLALMMTGQLRQAEDAFQAALRINPEYVQAANNLGLVYFKQGKTEMALPVFEKTMGPAKARNNLGCLLAWKGHYEKAAEMFNKAVEISPTYYKLAADHYEEVRYKADTAVPVKKKTSVIMDDSALASREKKSAEPKAQTAKPVTPVKVTVAKTQTKRSSTEMLNRASVMQSINALRPPAPVVKKTSPVVKAAPVATTKPKATKPAPKAAAKPSAMTAEAQGHFIQVASMSSRERADSCIKSWKKRGVQGHVEAWRAANGKMWYRVLLGPFKTKAEAEAKAQRLRGQGRLREFLLVDRGDAAGGTSRAMAKL